jgi:hypothetical protein
MRKGVSAIAAAHAAAARLLVKEIPKLAARHIREPAKHLQARAKPCYKIDTFAKLLYMYHINDMHMPA